LFALQTGEKKIQRGEDFVALGERLVTGFFSMRRGTVARSCVNAMSLLPSILTFGLSRRIGRVSMASGRARGITTLVGRLSRRLLWISTTKGMIAAVLLSGLG
jgi:hypothetical protein